MDKFTLPSMHELYLMHARADRAMRAVVADQLEAHHLTMMEWLALGVINRGSKSGLSMTEVAHNLDVTLPQVTALVAGLIDHKCIKQKIRSNDHRGRQVMVTLKGKRVLHKLETALGKSIRAWTKDIPQNRLREYMATIEHLSAKAD